MSEVPVYGHGPFGGESTQFSSNPCPHFTDCDRFGATRILWGPGGGNLLLREATLCRGTSLMSKRLPHWNYHRAIGKDLL